MQNRIFTKADIAFNVDGVRQEILRRDVNLSIFGVMGLRWPPLDPEEHFGSKVIVNVSLPTPESETFKTKALLVRERSAQTDTLGLRFLLEDGRKTALAARIARLGFSPQLYKRQYPRIPASESLSHFPVQVICQALAKKGAPAPYLPTSADTPPSVALHVVDLSPGGIRLATNLPEGLTIEVGQQLRMRVESRPGVTAPFEALGLVCRTLDEPDPQGGEGVQRQFGIKWVSMDIPNRVAFLALLKNLLKEVTSSSG